MSHLRPPSRIIVLSMLLVVNLVWSCRTTEKLPEARLRPMSSVSLRKKAMGNAFDYTHFSIKKVAIQLEKGNTRTSFRAGIQAVKEKSILISVTKLNILLGRILLTPDSVVYVNYFDKVYYAGGYAPVSKLLNFDLDFSTVQAVLSANIFSLIEDEKELREFTTWSENGMYILQSEALRKISKMEEKGKIQRVERILKRMNGDIPVMQTFFFDPELFVIRRLVLEERDSLRKAVLTFDDYEQVGSRYYPSAIDMVFESDMTVTRLNSRMSGFSTEAGEFVSLKIPDKYQRIYIN